jgi:hypothetical protein
VEYEQRVRESERRVFIESGVLKEVVGLAAPRFDAGPARLHKTRSGQRSIERSGGVRFADHPWIDERTLSCFVEFVDLQQ